MAWNAPYLDYAPVFFEHASVLENSSDKKVGGWAHPSEVSADFLQKIADECGADMHSETMLPLNPRGRTGRTGRGLLGKYGANYAADPFVTRHNPETGQLEGVFIQRDDTGDWALPGGMVEPGESVSKTLEREFGEETRNIEDMGEREEVAALLAALFATGGRVVCEREFVDDPRNTDHAWMVTTCVHFHIANTKLAENIKLNAGSDAAKVMWLPLPTTRTLYASHGKMVADALEGW